MERLASKIETAYLNRKFGKLPENEALVNAMAETLSSTRSNYVRCVWHGNCEYCERRDGTWVLRGCID